MIFALGREITIYNIAKKLLPKGKTSVSPSAAGALYTAKKELIVEKLIFEKRAKGRKKPIRGDVAKYFDLILRELDNKEEFRRINESLFEKYAPRIVDFIAKKQLVGEDDELSYPFIIFLFVRYLATVGNHFPKSEPTGMINKVYSFVKDLDNEEIQELSLKEKKEEILRPMFTLIPPRLFKEIFIELGVRVFDASIFLSKSFDYFLDTIIGENTKEEQKELLAFLQKMKEKKYERQRVEAWEYDQEIQDKILKEIEGEP